VSQSITVEAFKKLLGPGKYEIYSQVDRCRLVYYGKEILEGLSPHGCFWELTSQDIHSPIMASRMEKL